MSSRPVPPDGIPVVSSTPEDPLRMPGSGYAAFLRDFPFSAQILAPDGRTLAVNPAFEALWGIGLEAMQRFDLFADPQLEPVRELLRRGFAGEAVQLPPVQVDVRNFAPHVEHWTGPRWIQALMFPVRGGSGELREVVLIHQDVTSARETESALRRSEERYRTLFEASSDAIFIHDPVTGAVLDANRRACEITGGSLAELRARSPDFIWSGPPPFTLERAREHIHRAAAGDAHRFEWLTVNPRTGELLWSEVNLQRFTTQGEDRLLAVVRDIRERKQAEEMLRQANEDLERRVAERTAALAEVNRALGAEILEHRRVREQLQQRTRELEGILQAVPDTYARLLPDGTVIDCRDTASPAVVTLGIRIQEMRTLAPGAAGEVGEAVRRVARTGKPVTIEYEEVHDGQPRVIEARMVPLADATLIWLGRDITSRKKAERALQEREEHFRRLIENASDMVQLIDATGRISYTGPSVFHLLGYAPEEISGTDPMTYIHPDDLPETTAALAAMLANPGTARVAKYRVRHRDGSYRNFEAFARTLSPESAAEGVVVNARDVTERVEAEQALRRREEHYRALIENTQDIVTMLDAEGRIVYHSPAMQRILGYEPEELVGRTAFELVHPDDVQATLDSMGKSVEVPGTVGYAEYRFRHRDGSWRYLETMGRTILPDSIAAGLIYSSRDVTERKRGEEALRRATAEAERANRAKSEFLSRMSHELRTPMNSILGFAQLLARTHLPPQQARSVQHILKAGRHLLNLINEVLEIARIESGRHHLSLEPVGLGSAVEEAVGLVRPLAAQWGITLLDEPAVHSDAFVRADRQRLVQILLNLLSNAIKYNRAAGSVRVSCATGKSGECSVRVEDSGHGIPEAGLDQLFTPFARLGAEQTEVEGTGLGLALSQRLAEAMGGRLLLESTSPMGSVFRLDLAAAEDPSAALDEVAAPTAPAETASHRAATILYVEDNLANLSLVETILLSRPQWRTVPALQGQLGVELAREHLPDLVLLDLHLPDIPGEEVIRRLRAHDRTASIPVVVVSADATQRSVERLRELGADAYLTKPLDIDEFIRTVGHFLRSEES